MFTFILIYVGEKLTKGSDSFMVCIGLTMIVKFVFADGLKFERSGSFDCLPSGLQQQKYEASANYFSYFHQHQF